VILTTGRVVSQFLSGTQTRRIGPLVDQYPEPVIEIHPRLAEKYRIKDGEYATAESRRGFITLRARVVTTIRPDTIFVPYHWAGKKSINQLTISAQDPISKIPEYKVCAARVRPATPQEAEYAQQAGPPGTSSSAVAPDASPGVSTHENLRDAASPKAPGGKEGTDARS
jgi:assimilatory nitrate reductase catalytic subunit